MKKQNIDRARNLRRDATRAELALWQRLRNRSLAGHKFCRQEPIGPYIVDFVCRRERLIIEIDGGQHADQADQDEIRTAYLEAQGYRVIRFWNNEVLSNLEGVWLTIERALVARGSPHPPVAVRRAPPSPHRGEGKSSAVSQSSLSPTGRGAG